MTRIHWAVPALLSLTPLFAQSPTKYPLVDAHFHYLNFVQDTGGMDAFFKAMAETGVEESVVIGMPVVKKWDEGEATRPVYYLDNDSHA